MDRDNGPGALCDLVRNLLWVHVEGHWVHIYEHWLQVILEHHVRRGYEGNCWDQNLIAVFVVKPVAFFQSSQSNLQGGCSAIAEHSMATPVQLCKVLLELCCVLSLGQ